MIDKIILKICGLSNTTEVKLANHADYIGFIVGSPQSHRNINVNRLIELVADTSSKTVAVTVNDDLEYLKKLESIVDIIQLHGNARKYAGDLDSVAIACTMKEYKDYMNDEFEYIVMDSSENGYGGTGKLWEWKFIDKNRNKILIAGGISIYNFDHAIEITGADGIDISSSLEIDGVKSLTRIKEIIQVIYK